ncbi:MAG: FABP family protein [Acidimicrobiales bacterium]
MTATTPEPHPNLVPLQFLLGTWVGEGEGLWAGGFSFEDSLTFTSDGRPLVEFREVTKSSEGKPSHSECGYLLAKDAGVVHMTVAEPSGITETLSGLVDTNNVTLESVEIGHSPGTDDVTRTARRLYLDGDQLVVEVDIAVNGEELEAHTRSVLHRADAARG